MNVCVFGSYLEQGEKEKAQIISLGRMLAEKGHTVVSGGFGGTMEDISKGAKDGGGSTIGVTFYKKPKPFANGPNEYIDEEIITPSILARIEKMVEISDVFIVFPGGTGTLLELATVLEYVNKRLIDDPITIMCVGAYWHGVIDAVRPLVPNVEELVTFVSSVEEIDF